MTNVHPSLELLVTGYFHQDWDLDASSPAEVVARFAASEPSSAVQNAIASIEKILNRRDSEVAAEELLKELSSQFNPSAFGLTPRGWLQALRTQLKEFVSRS